MKLRLLHVVIAVLACTFGLAVRSQAQTLNYFADLNASTGWEPYSSVTQATDGNFFGTATNGIYGGGGNIFRMTPKGEITSVYKFCSQPDCSDGAFPTSAPILGTDGNLYGVTYAGGAGYASGVFYRLTLNGEYKVLYTFCPNFPCHGAESPNGITLGSDGNFYGTSVYGGDENGSGTIFKLTPSGTYTQLHTFCSKGCYDGDKPFYGPVEGNDGNFYGVTTTGGTLGGGVFYRLTPSGDYSVLYNFCGYLQYPCPNGAYPYAITKDSEGNFVGPAGVIFKITPSGKYTVLYRWPGNTGNLGYAGTPLILASDGNLYGTLDGSGSGSWGPTTQGAIYEITSDDHFKPLYGFCAGCESDGVMNGFNLLDPVFQGTDGNFYGTTAYGGIGGPKGGAGDIGFGTVFQFSNGLSPFVQTVPAAAKAGQSVIILGNGLSGTSSVTFNGVEAAFTVESDTYLRATVPAGATSGAVSVVTSSGTLNSSPQFQVMK